MSESSFLEVASAIRKVLQENLPVNQYPSTNRPTIEQLTPQPPIPQPFIDLARHASSWKLPEAASSELAALIPVESMKYQDVTGRAHLQLLQEIYASCDSLTAANLVPYAQTARDALHARMVNTLLDSVQHLATNTDIEAGAVSDADESSESDSESGSEDDDDDEPEPEAAEDPDEDDNAPMKPGEDVPPLETKFLPIFEALHERGKVLTKPEKTYLVNLTGMTYRQITIWFQNRRRGELKEDINSRLHTYAISTHSDQSSDLSDDDLLLEKKLSITQPSDTTFSIRSWRLASAVASANPVPAFPPSPTKVGFADASIPRPDIDDTDSDLSDSDDELNRSDNGVRVPSLTTSSATFDSSSDRGPATIVSASSSQVLPGLTVEPTIVTERTAPLEQNAVYVRPTKQLPSSRRATPPAAPQQQRLEQPSSTFGFNFAAPPTNLNPSKQFVSVTIPPTQPPQFVTSNERGLTVEMDTTPPKSTITLQSSSSITPTANTLGPNTGSNVSPSSPVLPGASPHSASSPSPSGNSGSSPRPAVKPLPRRTGCAPRPRPPPRVGPVATPATIPGSARASVVLPPSSNPSLAGTTLGALLRPNIPPPSIPPEMEERLSAMAGRMGVGVATNGQRRAPSIDVTGLNRPRPTFNFGPGSVPGAGIPGTAPGLSRGSSPKA
ncbi:hypothetical protein RSOLAG1IB_06622 [Rhizoctonia solani AG-1 IB]|uniref:Homeobox domain-containing protein n=2 Tax=Rhizoctonia solani TaxID=456999 RepID=M5BS08_THACB|nr:unnamed protein product [Rhizoctonia solani]CCO29981.1 hypothetical protein BN14_04005 [Rhizoctonia solani AG-1 IB]CEL53841.1 hypothetical protein RSOLAG1IB_06622 [Rhizoctonia solani AG-1 IB]